LTAALYNTNNRIDLRTQFTQLFHAINNRAACRNDIFYNANRLSGEYSSPQGFVSRVADTGESISINMTSAESIKTNRLDYFNTKFFSNEGYATIEFNADLPQNVKAVIDIPGYPGGHVVGQNPPYSGNGFIANTSGKLIPEYYIDPGTVSFLDGAEIYEFSSDGVGRLVAVYKYNEGWISI
jgi:hypothetical protein